MKSEEEWNVVQKVLVGDGRYREYRLTEALDTDRDSPCGSEQNIQNGINEIVADKASEILELKRRIKKLEISQSNWLLLREFINKKNETFFLKAVNAPKKSIERFELENFFSDNSWTQLRNVSELEEDEIKELLGKTSDDVVPAIRLSNKNDEPEQRENNTGNCAWVSKQLHVSKTSQVNGVVEQNCVANSEVFVSTTVSNGCSEIQNSDVTEDNDPLANNSASNITLDTVIVSVTDAAGSEAIVSIDQDLDDTTTTQVIVSTGKTVETDRNTIAFGEKLNGEEITVEQDCEGGKEQEGNPRETAECHSDNGDENTAAEGDEKQSSPKVGTCPELNDNSCPIPCPVSSSIESPSSPISENFQKEDIVQNDSKLENGQNQSNSSEPVKQLETECVESAETASIQTIVDNRPIADTSGYSKLRLTSSNSSKNPLPNAISPPIKATGNIWEQRAQQRKVDEEQRKLQAQNGLVGAQCEEKIQQSSSIRAKLHDTKAKEVIFKPTSKMAKHSKDHQKSLKSGDNTNGWRTSVSKNGNTSLNGVFSEETKTKEDHPLDVLHTTKSQIEEKKAGNVAQIDDHPKTEKFKEAEKGLSENESVDQIDDTVSKAEKRAKRRQKTHEKKKMEARKLGETNRNRHDLEIEEKKKAKELKYELDYKKKQSEIEQTRREREEKKLIKVVSVSGDAIEVDPTVKQILEIKDRLDKHLQEKNLFYQIIGSKIFVDKRSSELKNDYQTNINKTKYNVLNKFKQRQIGMEEMSMFLTFTSYHLNDNSNKFKLEDLLEYVTSGSLEEEPTTSLHKEIREAFEDFHKEKKVNIAECIVQATKFADSVIKRTKNMTDCVRTEDVLRVEQILTNYKNEYNEVVEFIGITSYLRTRMDEDLFMVEEDYLVISIDKENCGEEADTKSDDEDEYEMPEVREMSCQTEGEPYDVRAASFLPREK